MKRFWLCLMVIITLVIPILASTELTAMDLPEPTGYVVDTISLLKPATVTQLTKTCEMLDKTAQVAILVIASTQPYTMEQYSIKLAEKWKVGYKGKDNGIILILAKNDRKVRIEVGRGLEAIIPDAKAGRIINEIIIPYFKNGDWDGGMIAGLEAIKKEVLK